MLHFLYWQNNHLILRYRQSMPKYKCMNLTFQCVFVIRYQHTLFFSWWWVLTVVFMGFMYSHMWRWITRQKQIMFKSSPTIRRRSMLWSQFTNPKLQHPQLSKYDICSLRFFMLFFHVVLRFCYKKVSTCSYQFYFEFCIKEIIKLKGQ